MRKIRQIALLSAGLLAVALPAAATPVAYGFTATAKGGLLSGDVFSGLFTVDTGVIAAGFGSITLSSFNVLGTILNGSESAFGLQPSATFTGGAFTALQNFVVLSNARAAALGDPADGHSLPAPISSLTFSSGGFAYGTDPSQGETFLGGAIAATPIVTFVPEPAPFLALASGLVGLGLARRRRAR